MKLTIDQIEVPEGMYAAFDNAWLTSGVIRKEAFTVALLWLAENPIVPSTEQSNEMHHKWNLENVGKGSRGDYRDYRVSYCAVEWQRLMFLKREPVLTLSGEWPESTCVECGQKMLAGQMRKCPAGGEMGTGFCTHHVPVAIRKALELGKKAGAK